MEYARLYISQIWSFLRAFTQFENVSRLGCYCEVCEFNFLFAIYIVKNVQVGKFNNVHVIHSLD